MPEPITAMPNLPSMPGVKKPPGPRTLSPLSNASVLQRDPIRFALEMWHRYGDVVRFRFLFWPAYVLYHPDHVKRVLQENHRNYNKNFPKVDTIGRTFAALGPLISRYASLPFPPLWVPTLNNRRLLAGLKTLNTVVYAIINERRKQPVDTDAVDLLWMLLSAQDEETGECMNNQQLRDEVLTLLLAGHETTATALTWTWYLLSQHPEIERRLHTELDTVLAGQLPTVEHLDALPYTLMVIQEAMRLYPPAFGFTRFATASDEIGGYPIPANSVMFISAYCTHRHPAFWEEPEVFDPERFTPERSANRPRFAYFPFGGGPRQCIGSAFAMMEAQLVLATVAQRYTLRLVHGHSVEPQVLLTMRPRYGLTMTLHPRLR
jgi:cytochrome P450